MFWGAVFVPTRQALRQRGLVSLQSSLPNQAADLADSFGGGIGYGNDHFIELVSPALKQAFRHADHRNFVNALVPLLGIVVKKGHYGSAEMLPGHQFPGELSAGVSRANNRHAGRRAVDRAFPKGGAFAPEPRQESKAAERAKGEERIYQD